jgi:hypothetical protein
MPQLEPKTKEIWAGVRNLAGMVSELASEIADIRGALNGFESYKDFLRNQSSFDELESSLESEFSEVSDISVSDVEDTVQLLRDNFSYSDYKNDTDGTLSKADFDAYRSFLTSNGLSTVQADRHIQLLQERFNANATFSSDAGTHTDWDSFQTELENNGVSSSSAQTTIDDLKTVFTSVQAMDREVMGSDDWPAFQTYLEDNGLSSGEATGVVDDLKQAYGNTLDATAKDNFSAFDSFSEFEQYLVDQGFSADEASNIVQQIENNYADFDEFRTQVLSSEDGLTEILNNSSSGSETSDTGAGVRVFESSGTTEDGVNVPQGAVEVKGTEVHFSQLGSVNDTAEEEPDSGAVAWTALDVDNLNPFPGEIITVTGTVEYVALSGSASVNASLVVNGNVRSTRSIQIASGEVKTVSFDTKFDVGSYDVGISSSPTKTVFVNETSGL